MLKLILSLILPQLAGAVGALFTVKAIPTWYAHLNKPSFSPPNWLFGPVWLTLYLMMGVALYLNWIKKSKQAEFNVRLFFIHLFFNLIWTPIFFGAKDASVRLHTGDFADGALSAGLFNRELKKQKPRPAAPWTR